MPKPRISVVVSTRNRPDRIRGLVDALADQDIDPEDYEIVVVDDGSTEPIGQTLRSLPRSGGVRLRIVRNPDSRGPAAGRNKGWRIAEAPLVAFTDDDCRPARGWLRALLEHGDSGLIVQGRTVPDPRDGPPGPFARTQSIHGPDRLFETCNIAYPRTLLERVDGFDETFRYPCGEDVDLGWRASKAGGTLVFASDALVYHAVTEPSFRDQLRETTRWTDAVRALRLHPEARSVLHRRFFWKPTHPPLLVAVLGLAASLVLRRAGIVVPATAPYIVHRARRAGSVTALLARLPRHIAVDLCELATMVVGTIRHRTLML